MKRMIIVIAAFVVAVLSPPAESGDGRTASTAAARPPLVVYKSPTCGCCVGWVEHLRSAGYTVTTRDTVDLDPVKTRAGVPETLISCHTAFIGGYSIEGHVPATAIDRLLATRPAAKGLAVPGMPIGSPGMEGPNPEPYDVMLFQADGTTSVFMSIPAGK